MEAWKLELHHYMDVLRFNSEHHLSKKALIVDALIIKKDPSAAITKNIGRIFRTHNIVEFKSENDSLSVNNYKKVLAYALLYSAFEDVPLEDITVTFSLSMRPRELFRNLKNVRKLALHNAGDGITYIMGEFLPVQILEIKQLPKDENLFIKGLKRGNNADLMTEILEKYDSLVGLDARNAYIDRLIRANKDVLKGVMEMSEELKRILIEIIDENGWYAERDAKRDAALLAANTRETAIKTAKETAKKLLGFGYPIEEISIATNLTVEEVMELAQPASSTLQ